MNMKYFIRTATLAALAAVSAAGAAPAQSNRIPGPKDYDKFTAFISDRNVFDPQRVSHSYTGIIRSPIRKPRAAPAIEFVGTMSYEKGTFAFLSGNNSEYNGVLQIGDRYLTFRVASLCATNVVLEGTNNVRISLALGDGLRQENGNWVSTAGGEFPAASASDTTSSYSGDSSGTRSESAAPPSSGEPNEALKRLMQLREKENQ
jgi:hypothetical protein